MSNWVTNDRYEIGFTDGSVKRIHADRNEGGVFYRKEQKPEKKHPNDVVVARYRSTDIKYIVKLDDEYPIETVKEKDANCEMIPRSFIENWVCIDGSGNEKVIKEMLEDWDEEKRD